MAAYKIDIFKVLNAIADGNIDFFNTLDEETLKSVQPYVLMLWGMGINTDQDFHAVYLNEFVNRKFFAIGKHKKLQLGLLCVALKEPGARMKYSIPKKTKQKPLSLKAIQAYYSYNEQHASDALNILNVDDLVDLAEELGYEKPDITKIKKEWK